MDMCSRQIQLGILGKPFDFLGYRGAIAWPQSSVNHQTRALTNHYANVGKAAYGIYMFRNALNGVHSQLWIGIKVSLLRLCCCATDTAQAEETQTEKKRIA
jgi:hypothetical protein